MPQTNQHGLTRHIPAEMKRVVRQRCGFGCAICGAALYDYEHFEPDFKDAREHHPDGITLLCMQCNQKRRRGHLSRETVKAANAAPVCITSGSASETFDFSSERIRVNLGGVTFVNCETLIEVQGVPLLSICGDDELGPIKLSGFFSDLSGKSILTIDQNEWSVSNTNWDVECEGPRITIRSAPKAIALAFRCDPPNSIHVERLKMKFKAYHLDGGVEQLRIWHPRGYSFLWQGCGVADCRVGISV